MNPLYGEIRACIDSFVDDLARAVSDAIQEQVTLELDRLSLTSRASSALGRKKTGRGARRTRANGVGTEPRPQRPRKGRGRRKASDEQLELALTGKETKSKKAAAPAEPPPPPPLFVHKRTREGKIHHLSRAAGDGEQEAARPNGAANP